MSLVVENEYGYVICHQTALGEIYGNTNCNRMDCVRKFKTDLFNIITPFKMDSQVKDENGESVLNSEESQEQKKKRKRKRKAPLNHGESLALQFHEKVKDTLQKALISLVDLARTRDYLKPATALNKADNNRLSRSAAVGAGPSISLVDLCMNKRTKQDNASIRLFHQGEDVPNVSPVDTVWKYTGDTVTVSNILTEQFILPPRSTFLLSDLSGLQQNCHNFGKSDLIVLDPPWQNKSAKRLRQYWTMKNEDLLDLPVLELIDDCSLIIVWTTNKQAQIQFVEETLCPTWRIQILAHWFWLKVTKTGETVYDLDSPHKKPYESIIIGHSCHSVDQCRHKNFPSNKVVISVPCSLHSKKPPLIDILKPYLPNDPRCLELFARNLWPGWTSWGNEVLLHQHIDFFEPVT